MPPLKLPPAVIEFLDRPNAAVIGCVRPDGFPATVATWYDWDDGLVLINMDEKRSRLRWLRNNPKVSLTALDEDWYRHVSVYGLVVAFRDDTDLADIDRLSRRYRGVAYRSRSSKRVSAWIEPHGWHAWDPSGDLARKRAQT